MRYELYRAPKKLRDFMCTFVMATIELEYMEKYISANPLPLDEKYVIIDSFPTGRVNYDQLGLAPWADCKTVRDTVFECKRAKYVNEDGAFPRRYIQELKDADEYAGQEAIDYMKCSCFLELSDWEREKDL